ncbi:Uncharacterised protein [Mycobacteroides abscessus subsp. abscessus]|nr:Uncharacterised protein [Mycobacteroides abscessus subsp. abscessus]
MDLTTLFVKAEQDTLWQHTVQWWVIDVSVLAAIALVLALFTRRNLRLKKSAT